MNDNRHSKTLCFNLYDNSDKVPILFFIYYVNTGKRFCNRAIWLNCGALIMDGNTDEVTDRYLDFLKSDLPIEQYLAQYVASGEKNPEVEGLQVNAEGIDIAEIHGLSMYNSYGREIDEITHGQKVVLKVSYVVGDETIEEPVLGVAIRRIDNEYICGLNTKLDNMTIPDGATYVTFEESPNPIEHSRDKMAVAHYNMAEDPNFDAKSSNIFALTYKDKIVYWIQMPTWASAQAE